MARGYDPQCTIAVLHCLGMLSSAVFVAMDTKGGDADTVAVACEATMLASRMRLTIPRDQENAARKLVDMVRNSRAHETKVLNTPEGASASAGGIERTNYEVEKQMRTLRSRFEQVYGETVGSQHKGRRRWLRRHNNTHGRTHDSTTTTIWTKTSRA